MLKKIREIYGKSNIIKKDSKVVIDRSLSKKLSLKIFKYSVPTWNKMIAQMKNNKIKIYKKLKIK